MATKRGPDVYDVDGLWVKRVCGAAELVRAILVSVDGLVRDRRSEEEENARGQNRGGVEDGEGEVGERGERFRDGEFAHGWTERGTATRGEPPEEGGRGLRKEGGVDAAGRGVEREGGGGGGEEGGDSGD